MFNKLILTVLALTFTSSSCCGQEIHPILFTVSIQNSMGNNFGNRFTIRDDKSSGIVTEGGAWTTNVVYADTYAEIDSNVSVSVSGNTATINWDVQHDIVRPGPWPTFSFTNVDTAVSVDVWAPLGDLMSVTTSIDIEPDKTSVWRDKFANVGRPSLIETPGTIVGTSVDMSFYELEYEGTRYGQIGDVFWGGYARPRTSSSTNSGPRPSPIEKGITGSMTIVAENLSRAKPLGSLNLVAVDDSNPRNPTVFFEVEGVLDDVTWKMGPQSENLGRLGPGSYFFTPTNINEMEPALYSVVVEASDENSTFINDVESLDLNHIGIQSNKEPRFVSVSGHGLRSARFGVSADVFRSEWSLPGAMYDRRVTAVVLPIPKGVFRETGRLP